MGDVVIVGAAFPPAPRRRRKEMPAGNVMGFDARTGKRLWVFHTIARRAKSAATPGATTRALHRQYRRRGRRSARMPSAAWCTCRWRTPTGDFYGGHRPGDNLYASSLVCLDARTGKRVWHFQLVHHDIWDYDTPAPPVLLDITVNGRRIPAVAQVTKQGFIYVFDRVTGAPVWPIEERPVPQSDVPGEATPATQPIPTLPEPFIRQGVSRGRSSTT